MIVLACGGRDYRDTKRVWTVLGALRISMLVQGGARGADALAGEWAEAHGLVQAVVHADWDRHGRAAGHKRNTLMLTTYKPALVVAFPGGRGTADCVAQAQQLGIPVLSVS